MSCTAGPIFEIGRLHAVGGFVHCRGNIHDRAPYRGIVGRRVGGSKHVRGSFGSVCLGGCAVSDFVTVVVSSRRQNKRIQSNGECAPFHRATHFDFYRNPVASLDDVEALVRNVTRCPFASILRGELIDLTQTKNRRRLLRDEVVGGKVVAAATVKGAAHQWLALDMDGTPRPDHVRIADLESCAAWAIATLPEAFSGCSVVVLATASHGFKSGSRLRLFYWLDRPVSDAELNVWLNGYADKSLFNPVQLTYTAPPDFEPGVVDPVPDRIIRLPGKASVPVPEIVVLIPAGAGKRAVVLSAGGSVRRVAPAKAERWTRAEPIKPLLKDADVRERVHTVAVPPDIAFRLRGIDMVMRKAKASLRSAAEAGHCRAELYGQAKWLGGFLHTGMIEEDAAARYLLRHSLPRAVDYLEVIENGFAAGRADPRPLQENPKPDFSGLLRKAS